MQIANGFSWRKRKIQYIQILFFSVKLSLANFETFLGHRYLVCSRGNYISCFPLSPSLLLSKDIILFLNTKSTYALCIMNTKLAQLKGKSEKNYASNVFTNRSPPTQTPNPSQIT